MAGAARSAFSIFFPVEVYPVVAPVVLVAGLFTGMMTRIISVDPDCDKGQAPLVLDNPRDVEHGKNFKQHIRGFFADRIAAGHISIFANH